MCSDRQSLAVFMGPAELPGSPSLSSGSGMVSSTANDLTQISVDLTRSVELGVCSIFNG